MKLEISGPSLEIEEISFLQDCYYQTPDYKSHSYEYDRCINGKITTQEKNQRPTGRPSYKTKIFTCPRCKGTGKIPTELGQELVEFLEWYEKNK